MSACENCVCVTTASNDRVAKSHGLRVTSGCVVTCDCCMVKTICVITGCVAMCHEWLCGYVSPLIVCQHLCRFVSLLVAWLRHH